MDVNIENVLLEFWLRFYIIPMVFSSNNAKCILGLILEIPMFKTGITKTPDDFTLFGIKKEFYIFKDSVKRC